MKKTTILFIVVLELIINAAHSQVASYSFIASTGTYNSITGTSPALTGNGTDQSRDEGFANNIPLGFTFNYLGINYTTISASTNGFAAFSTIITADFSNDLASGGSGRPIVAPLWEDLSLNDATDLQYTTVGADGSKIFILQWGNVLFDFGAGTASLCFQLRLYESTNVIEFIYNQLPGVVQDFSGGASIGITSGITGINSFLSLDNSSSSPVASSTVATNTITTCPATGQVYTFTPPACTAPGGLAVNNITATGASVSWADAGAASYEYVVTTNPVPPASGTTISVLSVAANALTPCTRYYLHVRKNCGGLFSGWNSLGFATLCDAIAPPYTMPVSNVIAPVLPVGTTVKDENQDGNTWKSYSSAGTGWTDQVIAYSYSTNCTTPANDWLFTRGLNLTAGTYYRLRFKYNNDLTSLYTEKLKVAYGNATAAAAMTNILADYPSVYSATPKNVIIDFTPTTSGIFYIGFQAYSDANKDVLILDDISIDPRPSCDIPGNLLADVASEGTSATVSWTAATVGTPSGYEYAVITSAAPPASGTATTSLNASISNLVPYAQYYLHVRTNCGGAFSAWTTLAFATVGNDEPCKAITLSSGGATICANTALATISSADPASNCSSPNNTIWYTYTPVVNGTVVLHITTPSAPARPLHGWAGWYLRSSDCPDISLYAVGFCAEFGNNGNGDADDLISPFLTAGLTYYIMMDGYSDDTGEFCISIPPCSPAVALNIHDIISNHANVSWSGTGTYILEYGPSGFTPGTGLNAGGGIVINPAVSPQTITGLAYLTVYDVYVRQNCSATGNGYSANSIVQTFSSAGPPPLNDDCSGAVNLPVYDEVCGGATDGTTLYATPSTVMPLPSCGIEEEGYDDDVWFKFTPSPGQVFVTIDFESTGGLQNIVAQIYTSSDNTSSGTFTLFNCSDNDGPGDLPRFTSMPVTPGTTYFMRVFSHRQLVNSQFTICVTKGLLINDNASGAIKIDVDAGCTGAEYTNVGATQSVGEPTGSCSSTTGYATVWYKFTAPAGGAVKISTAVGSGNTLINTRVALFAVADKNDYETFNIIGCDEDGGSGEFGAMSVLYAAGLVPGNEYYIQVDKFDNAAVTGTFCLTVDKLNASMLANAANCNSAYQTPVGTVSSYKGWVSLMDDSSRLIALVKNVAGAPVNAYTVSHNINSGALRKDVTSNEYYLDRSYTINNTANSAAVLNVQFFFRDSELAALKAVDPAAELSNLRVTRQTATSCKPDFVAGNGANSELLQTGSGISSGVSWVNVNASGFANYYIHAAKSYLTAKVFLQGAYNSGLGRHKDVTTAWANILNTYATHQPYNTNTYADTAREGFGAGTSGGSGHMVVHVMNLNASGPGSLLAAMGSNRTIVFDVGGTINNFGWDGLGSLAVSNMTIDGSTAPSPGITLDNNGNGDCLSFGGDCHDIVVKNIRVRNAGNDGINVIGGYNILFDHISVSGSGDGNLDITDGAHHVTVQWSIFGPGKNDWSGSMLIAFPDTRDISVHHNLYSTSGSGEGARNPLVHNATDYVPGIINYLMADFTNNVIWNWGNATTGGFGYGSCADYGGTLQCRNNFYQSSSQPASAIMANHDSYGAKLYASGNVSGNPNVNPNDVSNVATPWAVAPVTMQAAGTAAVLVLDKAGPRPLDETDKTILNAINLTNCPAVQNMPPVVNAGGNIVMALPANSTTLTGTASDVDGTIASYSWSRVIGPITYNLGTADAATTAVTNLTQGTYIFKLTATDNNGATGSDIVTVTVINSGANRPPVAFAGNAITITLPANSTTLSGSGTDADGTVTSYAWTKLSGPAGFVFGSENAATTTLTNLAQGTYLFKLTVTDNTGATGSDNVTVIVNPAYPVNTVQGNYAGAETVANGSFASTGSATDILDWVLVEIKSTSGSTMARRAAFVREDGQIVDLDGVSPVSLYGLPSGYFI